MMRMPRYALSLWFLAPLWLTGIQYLCCYRGAEFERMKNSYVYLHQGVILFSFLSYAVIECVGLILAWAAAAILRRTGGAGEDSWMFDPSRIPPAWVPIGAAALLLWNVGLWATLLPRRPKEAPAVRAALPADVAISALSPVPGDLPAADDPLEAALRKILEHPPAMDGTITPSLPSLRRLAKENMPLLLWYLSSNPAWSVHGSRFQNAELQADRRWKYGDQWLCRNSYLCHDEKSMKPDLQIILSIKPKGVQYLLKEGAVPVTGLDKMTARSPRNFSIGTERFAVQLMGDARLTKAAVPLIEEEFAKVLAHSSMETSALPAGSVKTGEPSLDIGKLRGKFHCTFWVNPGEPGWASIRAYVAGPETPLHGNGFHGRPQMIGGSKDPKDLFYGHILFTTGTALLDPPLERIGGEAAIRFELWFTPSGGSAERRLAVKTIKSSVHN